MVQIKQLQNNRSDAAHVQEQACTGIYIFILQSAYQDPWFPPIPQIKNFLNGVVHLFAHHFLARTIHLRLMNIERHFYAPVPSVFHISGPQSIFLHYTSSFSPSIPSSYPGPFSLFLLLHPSLPLSFHLSSVSVQLSRVKVDYQTNEQGSFPGNCNGRGKAES